MFIVVIRHSGRSSYCLMLKNIAHNKNNKKGLAIGTTLLNLTSISIIGVWSKCTRNMEYNTLREIGTKTPPDHRLQFNGCAGYPDAIRLSGGIISIKRNLIYGWRRKETLLI